MPMRPMPHIPPPNIPRASIIFCSLDSYSRYRARSAVKDHFRAFTRVHPAQPEGIADHTDRGQRNGGACLDIPRSPLFDRGDLRLHRNAANRAVTRAGLPDLRVQGHVYRALRRHTLGRRIGQRRVGTRMTRVVVRVAVVMVMGHWAAHLTWRSPPRGERKAIANG